jgi:hypothetical protein
VTRLKIPLEEKVIIGSDFKRDQRKEDLEKSGTTAAQDR